MARIECFMMDPTDRQRQWLRRFSFSAHECSVSGGYHEAMVPYGEVPAVLDADGHYEVAPPGPPHDDPRWPARCGCGYGFSEEDTWQVFQALVYVRRDTGEEFVRPHTFPPGAMWYSDWHAFWCVGPDGRCLSVMTPGGEWLIDSRASNCTRRDDNVHKCWIRHGVPPDITVDKNGDTCAAGAGSIQCGTYHGFLRNGFLED